MDLRKWQTRILDFIKKIKEKKHYTWIISEITSLQMIL